MPLTPKEAFRMGFLMRCAEEGCDMAEITSRTKFASDLRELTKKADANALWQLISNVSTLPLQISTVGLAAGALGGGAAGYGLAKLTNRPIDPEEAKRQELISAYKLQTDKIRQQMAMRQHRPSVPKTPSFL